MDVLVFRKSLENAEVVSFHPSKNIKLNNGAVVTPFNQALMETMQNEKASIQLAVLLKNRRKNRW